MIYKKLKPKIANPEIFGLALPHPSVCFACRQAICFDSRFKSFPRKNFWPEIQLPSESILTGLSFKAAHCPKNQNSLPQKPNKWRSVRSHSPAWRKDYSFFVCLQSLLCLNLAFLPKLHSSIPSLVFNVISGNIVFNVFSVNFVNIVSKIIFVNFWNRFSQVYWVYKYLCPQETYQPSRPSSHPKKWAKSFPSQISKAG